MNTVRKLEPQLKRLCSSAYKALILLKYLLKSPLKKSEIVAIYEKDRLIEQPVAVESVKNFISALKEVGCSIDKPSVLNHGKYKLNSNPFFVSLTKDEVDLINKFRLNPYEENDCKSIIDSNSLINKLCLVINDKKAIDSLKNFDIIGSIPTQTIIDLNNSCRNKDWIEIRYRAGLKISKISLITTNMKVERERLYVCGYIPDYKDFSYFRVDKILSYSIIRRRAKKYINGAIIRYKTFNMNHKLTKREYIVEKTDKYLIIDFRPENTFHSIQRFLEMGNNCEILYPMSFKNDFLSVVRRIKAKYDS